jgi:hypothetical protein
MMTLKTPSSPVWLLKRQVEFLLLVRRKRFVALVTPRRFVLPWVVSSLTRLGLAERYDEKHVSLTWLGRRVADEILARRNST